MATGPPTKGYRPRRAVAGMGRLFGLLDTASGELVGYSYYAAIWADSFGRALDSEFCGDSKNSN